MGLVGDGVRGGPGGRGKRRNCNQNIQYEKDLFSILKNLEAKQ